MNFMENTKKNSVFVHEDSEKWPIRLLEKTTLKTKHNISKDLILQAVAFLRIGFEL